MGSLLNAPIQVTPLYRSLINSEQLPPLIHFQVYVNSIAWVWKSAILVSVKATMNLKRYLLPSTMVRQVQDKRR